MLEKYIDNQKPGADKTILAYLATGWYIYYEGITLTILRKDTTNE